MQRSYEELMGATGEGIYFRPERRRVRELLSREASPEVLTGGRSYPLFDISMNGLSVVSRDGIDGWRVDDEIGLVVRLHGLEAYAGRARVARVEPGPRGSARIGLALVGGFLDLPEIQHRDQEQRLTAQLADGPAAAWAAVPESYRLMVAEAVHFLQYYRRVLDGHQRRYGAGGAAGRDRILELAERACDAIRPKWRELCGRASQAAVACLQEPAALLAAKELTEAMVTPLLLDCPMVRRSYTKPLGYPGDYQVMLYYYNNALEGGSVFARVFHKYFVEHPLSAGVRTRKDMIVEVMEREHRRVRASRGEDSPFRVLSLGCGPGREVRDFIRQHAPWPGRIRWTLVDQEEEALSVAYGATQRELAVSSANGSVVCLNLAFSQILADPTAIGAAGQQDFVFATGLFDYLRESRARELIAGLARLLSPGGLLAIGNAVGPNEHFWSPEFVLDWTLLYRTRDEMRRLAADVPGEPEVEVVEEPGKAYYFLLVRQR